MQQLQSTFNNRKNAKISCIRFFYFFLRVCFCDLCIVFGWLIERAYEKPGDITGGNVIIAFFSLWSIVQKKHTHKYSHQTNQFRSLHSCLLTELSSSNSFSASQSLEFTLRSHHFRFDFHISVLSFLLQLFRW